MDQYQLNISEQNNSNENESLLDSSYLKYFPISNPGLIAIIRSPDTKILFINPSFGHYLGYSNTDLSGNGLYFNNLLCYNEHDHLVNQLNYVDDNVAARSNYVMYHLKSKKNEVIPFYLYAAPFVPGNNPYGKLYFILMHPDLSKFGMPFTSFDSKELFLEQFSGDYFGTFELIQDMNKIFCSESIYRIYEIDRAQHDLNTFFFTKFVYPDDKARVKEATIQAFRTGQDLNIEYRIVTANQNVKLIHCLARSIKNDAGKLIKFVGSIRDITEQRSIEETLKKIEKATLQGEKHAAAGRLVRTIAHEVRNPLNNITLSIEQMQQEIKEENMQLYMNIIQRNGKRINDLISELLDTSRPSHNTLEKQTLQNILDDVIAASLDRLTLKRINLQISYPKDELRIMADKEKLMLALLNIVTNAIEAMDEQVGRLSISLQNINNNAVLIITDNGCGISEENISHLFEPYFTQKRNGIGLGLTFTLNILQAHKAHIEVSSQLNKGSAFTITFPLAV